MKFKADILLALSIISIVMSAIVSITQKTIWLAGTQWILIGIALGIYAIYFKENKAS